MLDPFAEVAGSVIHPVRNTSISKLRRAIGVRPLEVGICGGESTVTEHLIQMTLDRFADAEAFTWEPGSDVPELLIWHEESGCRIDELPPERTLDLSREHGLPTDALFDVLVSAGLAPSPMA